MKQRHYAALYEVGFCWRKKWRWVKKKREKGGGLWSGLLD